MFKITFDQQRRMIKVEVSGLGTVSEVALFRIELESALARLRWRSDEYVFLMHTLDGVVQTQAVMEAFADMLKTFPVPARKVAVVKTGALASLQSRRVLNGDRSALFSSVTEAECWLFS